jgi:hypothetical protein
MPSQYNQLNHMPNASLSVAWQSCKTGTIIAYFAQELAESKKRLAAQEKEGVRLTQLLDIEKSSLAEAKEELHGLHLEIKDLIAQRARDSAQVAAAGDARRQWEAVQV